MNPGAPLSQRPGSRLSGADPYHQKLNSMIRVSEKTTPAW